MNYVTETLNFQLNVFDELNDELFEQMAIESEFINVSLESMEITLEAIDQAVQSSDNKESLAKRVIAFIKKIIAAFIEKVKSLFNKDKEFIEKNKKDIVDNVKYEDITIDDIDETLTQDPSAMIRNIESFTRNVQSNRNNMDDFIKGFEDGEGSVSNGLKQYFRVGNSKTPLRRVKGITGSKLKNIVEHNAFPYVETYGSDKVNVVKKNADILSRFIDSMTAPSATTESFLLIENAFIHDTELVHCKNFALLEAEVASNNASGSQQEPSKSTTSVSLTVKDNPDSRTTSNTKTAPADNNKKVISFIQSAIAAMLTVTEQRYVGYMNLLKSLHGSIKTS